MPFGLEQYHIELTRDIEHINYHQRTLWNTGIDVCNPRIGNRSVSRLGASTSSLPFADILYRIMFSIDYPYETIGEGAKWFDSITKLTKQQKEQFAFGNASKLLKLDQ